MQRLLSLATRIMPLLIFTMVAVSLIQFFDQHGVTASTVLGFLSSVFKAIAAQGWIVLAAAMLTWTMVFVGVYHEHHARVSPLNDKRGWMMDILDRLTNRKVLEEKMSKQPDAVYIDAEALALALKSKIIGQDAVCEDMAQQIRRRLALKQRGKPVGVFLLAGPPGTGKTYLAKCLSVQLNRPLKHFDMTQFSTAGFGATALFGTAKGYVGSDSYGKLTQALRDSPDSVVLLDEFEKAHASIHKNFLTAWNDGFVTEASDGKLIPTTEAIFITTTNAATDALQSLSTLYANDPDELRRTSTNALREAGFAPELLNRLDRIFIFKPLTGLDIARVTALEIEAMVKNYDLDVSTGGIDPDVLIEMMARQDRLGKGASSRDIVRAIEESIADSLIEAKQKGFKNVSLYSEGNKILAKPQS